MRFAERLGTIPQWPGRQKDPTGRPKDSTEQRRGYPLMNYLRDHTFFLMPEQKGENVGGDWKPKESKGIR